MAIPIPTPIRNFLSQFPLRTYPPIERTSDEQPEEPTLWILPPEDPANSVLSADVECLKWQAYIALRPRNAGEGYRKDVKASWDVSPAAGVDGSLPTLCIRRPNAKTGRQEWKFLGPKSIAEWIDGPAELHDRDGAFTAEGQAWVQLLEGNVHDALIALDDSRGILSDLGSYLLPGHGQTRRAEPSRTTLMPSTDLGTLFQLPIPRKNEYEVKRIRERFSEAIKALSTRLGNDDWFLGSRNPTPLDALAFAYLCKALGEGEDQSDDRKWARREVWKYVNLVRWEAKVRKMVDAFYR